MPGVLAVFTGADCAADGLKPIPHDPVPKTKYDMKLAGARRHAESSSARTCCCRPTRRAMSARPSPWSSPKRKRRRWTPRKPSRSTTKPLPFVVHARDALDARRAGVWDEMPDNCCVDTTSAMRPATDRAFAEADHVVKLRHSTFGRVTGVPMEPRAALGDYDAATGRYTLYAGSGGAVRQKHELAGVLGVAPDQVRVLSFDVGGNFGTTNRALCRIRPGAVGGAEGRPPGQMDRHRAPRPS